MTKCVFDILPKEINTLIYREVFNLCLKELNKAATQKHNTIINHYSCSSCNTISHYPEKHEYTCPNCNNIICSYCNWHIITRYKRHKIKKTCLKCA